MSAERPPGPGVAEHVARIVALPGRLLVVADFDGTLAEFDPDPMGAVMLPGARRVIRRLAGIAAARPDRLSIAVLTGRASLDVASRVRIGGIRYIGNMGNESGLLPRRVRAERLVVTPAPGVEAHPWRAERLAEAVVSGLRDGPGAEPPAWLFVEPKGPAVAFHYRAAPDRAEARLRLDTALDEAGRHGLLGAFTRIEGRFLVDFQPTGAGAKGEATERLIDEVRPVAALVVGDDRADAEAFGAVRRARQDGRLLDGLAVAVRHPHPLPPEVEATADLVVEGVRSVVPILTSVARALERDV